MPRKKKTTTYTAPDWFKKIPPGSHGSNPDQKRLWKLVSDYVRERDFKRYGCCVACKRRFESWKDGQAGHFRAWSLCNGMFKYHVDNLALICQVCNYNDDAVVGAQFTDEMRKRHGKDFVEWVLQENNKHRGEKMELPLLVAYAEEIRNR